MKNCNIVIAYFQNFPMSYSWARLALCAVAFLQFALVSKKLQKRKSVLFCTVLKGLFPFSVFCGSCKGLYL